MTKTSRT